MSPAARVALASITVLALAGSPMTAAAESRGRAARAERELPAWVRAVEAGELELDRAVLGLIEVGAATRRDLGRQAVRGGLDADLTVGLLAALLGPDRGGSGVLAALLEPPRALVARPVAGAMSSAFGVRRDPIKRRVKKAHNGIDIRAARNTPVFAAGDGVVTVAARQRGYGRVVYIDHGDGVETRYAHLQSFAVEEGDEVIAGQRIARSGSSGRSTGPHLHFEVRQDGVPVPPAAIAELPLARPALGPIAELFAPLIASAERARELAEQEREAVKARSGKRGKARSTRPSRRELRSRRPQS